MLRGRPARLVGRIVTAAALMVGLTVGVAAPLLDVGFAPVLSPSMRPALEAGDLAVVRTVPSDALSVGTIVLLAGSPDAGPAVVAHRIVTIDRDEAGLRVRTQGDANPTSDARTVPITESDVEVVVGRIPSLGHLAVALSRTPARIAIVAVVLVALLLTVDRATRRRTTTRHGSPRPETSRRTEQAMHDRPLGRRPGRPRRRPTLIATLAAVALMTATLVTAAVTLTTPASTPPASAAATGPTVLAAALEQYGIDEPAPVVLTALERLLDGAIDVGVMDHGVLTVVAGEDPLSVPCFVGAHLRRERERWADVGPVWSRAHERLGLMPGGCTPGDGSPCGLVLRLRLMTDAARELAARDECDLDCAHRLQRLQQRLDTTAREVDELDVEQLGAGSDAARDAARLVEEARSVMTAVGERIRVAEEEAPVPDPGFDLEEECDIDDTARTDDASATTGPTATTETTEGARP